MTGCGNGIATAGEECDDGNIDSGDGCESDCTLPPGCEIYVSTDVPKPILDYTSMSSTLTVSSAATVIDVAVVNLRGTHTYLSDLQFVLQNPAAVDVTIIDSVCGSLDNFNLSLSDDAPSPITCPATDGLSHQPSDPLSAFDGGPTGGTWTLTIHDLAGLDEGQLEGWGLRICSTGCGNGAVEAGEECDDGNILSGDCCSSSCQYEASGNSCSVAAQPCGSGTCDGAGTCGAIVPIGAGSECRPAAGECDIAETCDGVATSCPPNGVVAADTPCGDAGATLCTAPDTCDGFGSCQPNHAPPFTECRAAVGECDATEYCDNGICPPDAPWFEGFPCSDDGNQCTDDVCDGNGVCEHPSSFGFCDDNNACTQTDYCDGSNTCVGYDPLFCDDGNVCTIDTCNPTSGCDFDPAPASGCKAAQSATLILRQRGGAGDKQLFKWLKGDALSQTQLGDPTSTTEYGVCIFSGPSDALLESFTVPAAGGNWSAIGDQGYKYKEPTGTNGGITKVLLKGGDAGKTRALVKGKGNALPDPTLTNLPLPVTAQVINPDTGVCVEAVFDTGDVKKNTDTLFKAKAQ